MNTDTTHERIANALGNIQSEIDALYRKDSVEFATAVEEKDWDVAKKLATRLSGIQAAEDIVKKAIDFYKD